MESDNQAEVSQFEEPAPVVLGMPVYTYILLACIGAVFVAQILFGNGLSSLLIGDERSALAAGFVKPDFLKYHEYWRILTGATVHGGLLHVLMNGYALLIFGRIVELLSNRAHLAIVFLLSCIAGGLLSLYFIPDGVSVGASGGIVGLIGYLAVYAFKRRDFISKEFRRSLIFNIGFIFLYGLLLYQVIDNFGHLGGLITGGVYGLIQISSDPYTDPREAGAVTRFFGVAALLVYISAAILSVILIANYR